MSDLLAQAEALEAQARDAIQRAHDRFKRSDGKMLHVVERPADEVR